MNERVMSLRQCTKSVLLNITVLFRLVSLLFLTLSREKKEGKRERENDERAAS